MNHELRNENPDLNTEHRCQGFNQPLCRVAMVDEFTKDRFSTPDVFQATNIRAMFLVIMIMLLAVSVGLSGENSSNVVPANLVTGGLSNTSINVGCCPFCSSINPTIAEQFDSNDAIVVVKLVEQPPALNDDDLELPKGKFEVVQVLKGERFIAAGNQIKTILIGPHEIGDQFMVLGVDPPSIAWSTPIRTTDRVVEYFKKIPSLPAAGVERLVYFQEFFEDEETVLANDAYDEFALAPYKDVIDMKDRMHHDKLVEWIKDGDVLESRKRLYFTMLGVCGTKDDVPFIEEMLAEKDREKRPGLDAMVACYLRILGEEGLPYIEKLFLSNLDAEYIDVFSVIQALRFHTTETDQITKARVAQSMRLVLDHPKIADIVIPDLARLEDWSVVSRLADMYRNAAGPTKWVRTPIASYMFECPQPVAKELLDEFRQIDADAVNRAELMASFDAIELDDDDEDVDGDEIEDDGETEDDDEIENDDKTTDKKDKGSDQDILERDNIQDEIDSEDIESTAILNVKVDGHESGISQFVSTEAPLDAQLPKIAVRQALKLQQASGEQSENSLLAQNSPDSSPVASVQTLDTHWTVIVGSLGLVSVALFALLWSVINGWFERLIF